MGVFDEADIIFGQAGLPGANAPVGQIGAIESRLTDLEALPVPPDSITDLADVDLTGIAAGDRLKWDGAKVVRETPGSTTLVFRLQLILDGGGAAITTGVKGDIVIPAACTLIPNAVILADASGSISVDVWRDTYANYPPTSGDSITGGNPLVLASQAKNTNNLAGWTTALAADDVLRFNVTSAATVQRVTISLRAQRQV
jgi:hypothetical protein